jgi:MinD-like ATPase involved in chromosome partitioning or flagellar assembly
MQADVPESRVADVLGLVELREDARRRVGDYSLGMRQRLGLAAALLGDPEVLVLDEPANGLDPAGVRWLRDLLRGFAAEGRTVLVSSHVLAEVAQTVDRVLILDRGRLRADAPLRDLLTGAEASLEDMFLAITRGETPTVVAAHNGTAPPLTADERPSPTALADPPAPPRQPSPRADEPPAPAHESSPPPAPAHESSAPLEDPPALSAVVADIEDEDELDRGLGALAWPPTPRIVAVTRAKGGAGGTTLALALADVLAREGRRRVACLDADPGSGTLLAIAGGDASVGGLDDVVDAARRIGTVAALARHGLRRRGGCDVFGFPPGEPPSALGPADYPALLELCAHHYEVVVVDVGGSPLAPLGSLCVGQAQHAVVVSTADPTAAAVTASALQGLDPRRATVVVNGADPDALARPASAAAVLRPLTAGRPLALPADLAFRRPPWSVDDLDPETRLSLKRLALGVAGELAR